jgi:NDP-sugar pyrophosphorylase family protein
MKNTVFAMVLAAGLGTRLKQFTLHKPKALLEINGKTLLEIILHKLSQQGFTDVVINVHHFADQIIDYLNHNNFDITIHISDERNELLDTGGAILKALPLFPLDQPVMVHNVDIFTNFDLYMIRQQFIASEADACLLVQNRLSSRKLLFDHNNHLIGWKNEKDSNFKWVGEAVEAFESLSFSGIHFFNPSIFRDITPGKRSIIDLYLHLASHKKIFGLPAPEGIWFDIGKAEELPLIEKTFNIFYS